MLPEEAKSSYQMADSGYDTYLRDAHRQVNILLNSLFYESYVMLKLENLWCCQKMCMTVLLK